MTAVWQPWATVPSDNRMIWVSNGDIVTLIRADGKVKQWKMTHWMTASPPPPKENS